MCVTDHNYETLLTPTSNKCFLGPTPDSIKSLGDPIVPELIMTSFEALANFVLPCFSNQTPSARLFLSNLILRQIKIEFRKELYENIFGKMYAHLFHMRIF